VDNGGICWRIHTNWNSSYIYKALNIILTVGEFTLTGIDALLKRGYTIVTEVGAFIITWVTTVIGLPSTWRPTGRVKNIYMSTRIKNKKPIIR